MYPYWVFISYAHADRLLAQQFHDRLTRMGLCPVWDAQIDPGFGFNAVIQKMIASAHVVMPLLTHQSQSKPWIHQEIGYAMGIRIPVLPIALGSLPGEMLAQHQAIEVEHLEDLPVERIRTALERLVVPLHREPMTTEVTDYPLDRVIKLVTHAEGLLEKEYPQRCRGMLRQRAPLSSLSIPNRPVSDPIWRVLDGDRPREDQERDWILRERQVLEQLARRYGCSLVLSPELDFPPSRRTGTAAERAARRLRLETLAAFLREMPEDRVEVSFSSRAVEGNWTILGDAVSAESQLGRSGLAWRQTIFQTHPPSVLRDLRRFDREKEGESAVLSRTEAIERIERAMTEKPAPVMGRKKRGAVLTRRVAGFRK